MLFTPNVATKSWIQYQLPSPKIFKESSLQLWCVLASQFGISLSLSFLLSIRALNNFSELLVQIFTDATQKHPKANCKRCRGGGRETENIFSIVQIFFQGMIDGIPMHKNYHRCATCHKKIAAENYFQFSDEFYCYGEFEIERIIVQQQ